MYTFTEASRITGLSIRSLKRLITEGRIPMSDKTIPPEYVKFLQEEQRQYISLQEYASLHKEGRFDGGKRKDCLHLWDILEQQDWFGAITVRPEDILSGSSDGIAYFLRQDVPLLDEGLAGFFTLYGLTEEEKAELYLSKDSIQPGLKYLIRSFLLEETGGRLSPSHASFVRLLTEAPDPARMTDQDVKTLFQQPMGRTTRMMLVRFLNQARTTAGAGYSRIRLPAREARPFPAYSDEQYIGFARCIFNPEYIYRHQMIEKALTYAVHAEMWLYLAILFVCAWRGGDVCKNWVYPDLHEMAAFSPDLHPETLRDDILNDRISEESYVNICRNTVATVEASMILPSKNSGRSPSPLALLITPEMYSFYGLLTLICEYHHMQDPQGGHLSEKRASTYQNRVFLKEFFGSEFTDLLQGENLHSRRLNKDYLQGVEDAARRTGCGAVAASTVASYARSHTGLNTIQAYLCDHRLTGENAGMVVYTLMERGVFAFSLYHALQVAYPDSFSLLSAREQTRVITQLDMSPMQAETEASLALAAGESAGGFIDPASEKPEEILRALFEISQGRGAAKDEHCYCVVRALGCACPHPCFASCLASGCDSLILTRFGIRPLLEVLKTNLQKEREGDQKAGAVLRKHLIPRYQKLMNWLVTKVAQDEGQEERRKEKEELGELIKRLTGEEMS